MYTRGSGVTGVTFARQGRLELARLNAVRSLNVDSLQRLQTLTMPTYSMLTTLSVKDTPQLTTRLMADAARNLQRVRLIGVDWQCENADTLMRLSACAGLDDEGRDSQKAVITGRAHINKATQEELDHLRSEFQELEITCDAIVPSYTVRFLVEGEVKYTVRVAHEGTVRDPVAAGLLPTPAKQSDVEHVYSYTGWDRSLQKITSDTDIHAVFAAQDRYYSVRYWYDAVEEHKAQEFTVIAHGSCEYTAQEPEREGDIWIGWDGESEDVVADMDIHPVFITPVLPETVMEQFDYLYSDDPADDSAYTLAEFAGILAHGRAKDYFQIGDRIKVVPRTDVFADESIVLRLAWFDHYRLADGSGFAPVTFEMVGIMNAGHRMNATDTNTGGWADSEMRAFLNGTIFPVLPVWFRQLVRTVQVRSSIGGTKASIATSNDQLFLTSAGEYFQKADVAPYRDEVDPEAEVQTFSHIVDTPGMIKKTHNGEGEALPHWLRSPDGSNSGNFMYIHQFGGIPSSGASSSMRLSWLCCM